MNKEPSTQGMMQAMYPLSVGLIRATASEFGEIVETSQDHLTLQQGEHTFGLVFLEGLEEGSMLGIRMVSAYTIQASPYTLNVMNRWNLNMAGVKAYQLEQNPNQVYMEKTLLYSSGMVSIEQFYNDLSFFVGHIQKFEDFYSAEEKNFKASAQS